MRLHDMGSNDLAVQYAVMILAKNEGTFTYGTIAEICKCSVKTIERTMPKLLAERAIVRTGSKRTGFRYELGEKALIHAYTSAAH